MRQRFFDNAPCTIHQTVIAGIKAAGYDLWSSFHPAGEFVDGDNGQHDTVFAQVAAVFNNQILNHVGARSGIDADSANVDAPGFAGVVFVKLENVAAFDQDHFADGA